MRQALHYAMQDNIAEVERCYVETQKALRQRLLPASDVATRMRLTKDAQTYLAARVRQKEAQYEALLAAGRTQWHAGERVRFYRAQDGTSVWLPDEANDISPLEENKERDTSEKHEMLFRSSSLNVQAQRRDYDIHYYLEVLLNSYAERLRVAFLPEDFLQLFRLNTQKSFFDRPLEQMQVRWIRCTPTFPEVQTS